MQISFNVRDAVKDIDELRAKAVPGAIRRAMTRSLQSAATAVAREMATDLGLAVGAVKKELKSKVIDDGGGNFSGRLSVSGKRIPLIEFKARGNEPSRGRGRGVSATIGKSGRKQYPGSFITTLSSGHRGVFQRTGAASSRKSRGAWSKNLPIAELKGPSLPHVFDKKIPVAVARFQEQIVKELQHEVSRALQKGASS